MSEMEYMSLSDAAKYLGVSRNKLWRMVKDGRLEAYDNPKDDRVKLVKQSDLDALQQPKSRGIA
jgi:excisionase family DNA binding protein